MQTGTIAEQMQELCCCVIIPTYNNGKTLEQVIRGVERYTNDVIIVNDGSTDETSQILERFSSHTIVNIPTNRGKGNALREGFQKAISMGFRYAITLDSDGQHFPDDIPAFVALLSEHPGSLIIGARNMSQENVPSGSSFGHKFSIFWFKVETGLKVPDVQTGFRLYPLYKIDGIRFFTRKFEFEVEVLVRAAWKGIPILHVPVKVYYAPKGERVTHFRKFRDFNRTGLLNTILVLWALFWVRPLSLFRNLKEKSWKDFFNEKILKSQDTNFKLAASVALGASFSSLPIWGWQMVAVVAVAYALRLNKLVAFIFSNLSIPPVLPFILFLSYITGGWVMGNSINGMHYDKGISLEWVSSNLVQYLVGSFVFSILFGLALGLISYLLLSIFRKNPPVETES